MRPDARGGVDAAWPAHGGDLAAASRLYGVPDEGWLDLSTGINPHAYPLAPLAHCDLARLPEPADLLALEEAARSAYGARAAAILAGPGTQALIHALPACTGAAKPAILAPTYSGHDEAWRVAGMAARQVGRLDPEAGDCLVLVNPNNPDGRVTPRAEILAAAESLAARGGLLVADEAFADFAPAESVAAYAGRPGLLVLRSFGKAYGLAGLRLGFALGEAGLIARLRARLGAWPVSGPAIAAGRAALADAEWPAAMRARLEGDAARLDTLLADAGFALLGGTPLFRLARHEDARALHAGLARAGIWTRAFSDMPDRIRFGLPGSEAGWARLTAALGPGG